MLNTALKLIHAIQHYGGDAYLVGGCVRDIVLDTPPHDFDITTSIHPEEIVALFSRLYGNDAVLPTGLQHGTVTVVIDNVGYEITTYRKETVYSDNRHPDQVIFADSIEEDCSRRDFTINAMYYDGERIVDLYDGQQDIEDKIIRTVGNPNERFSEDALRMLRAFRFSSKLGFDIAPNILEAITANKELIHNISAERIFSELSQILVGDGRRNALTQMQQTGLLKEIIPELDALYYVKQNNKYHHEDAFNHSLSVLDACYARSGADVPLLYAALFHDLGKSMCMQVDDDGTEHFVGHAWYSGGLANAICLRLKMPNSYTKTIVDLTQNHECRTSHRRSKAAKFVAETQYMTDEEYRQIETLWIADAEVHLLLRTDDLMVFINNLEDVLSKPHRIADLSVNGDDLLAMGYSGEEIGKRLKFLLKMSMTNDTNDKEKLLKMVTQYREV